VHATFYVHVVLTETESSKILYGISMGNPA